MTTLDSVHLLEEKVESAVEKIQQLQAENDALRKKCAELTNALSSKTEQLTSFTSNKDQIEDGIKKALDRLNFIENSVLKTGAKINPNGQASIQITPGVSRINEEELNKVQKLNVTANTQVKKQSTQPNFDTMKPAAKDDDSVKQEANQFAMEPEFDLLSEEVPEDDLDYMSSEDTSDELGNDEEKPFIF